jgi:hypothetical protein
MLTHIIGWLGPPSLPEQIICTAVCLSHAQREVLLKAACFLLASTVRVWWLWTEGGWVRI